MYLFLIKSQSVDYPSYPALFTLMMKLSMTPSLCRPVWRKWRTPSPSTPLKALLSMRGEEPLDEELDPRGLRGLQEEIGGEKAMLR